MAGRTTLIVPDIHMQWRLAEAKIAEVQPDRVVFLGDYFDAFHDTPFDAIEVAKWLRASLQRPERVHLWGNHDIHYAHRIEAGAGWTIDKHRAIACVMQQEDWARLRWFTWVDGWLCTHAGLHPAWLPDSLQGDILNHGRVPLTRWLEQQVVEVERSYQAGQPAHWMTVAGTVRGGLGRAGGLLWLDWTYEFRPLRNTNQIVGHTPDNKVRWVHSSYQHCKNVCLDVLPYGSTFGLMRSGDLKILSGPRDATRLGGAAG